MKKWGATNLEQQLAVVGIANVSTEFKTTFRTDQLVVAQKIQQRWRKVIANRKLREAVSPLDRQVQL